MMQNTRLVARVAIICGSFSKGLGQRRNGQKKGIFRYLLLNCTTTIEPTGLFELFINSLQPGLTH